MDVAALQSRYAKVRDPGRWLSAGLSAIGVLVVAAIIVRTGPSHMVMAPWDVFILLDGAWRILEGQIPHTDFYNPIGPLAYMLIAIGMRVGGEGLVGQVYGGALLLLLAGGWAIVLSYRKLPPILGFLFVVFIASLIVAPRALGFDPVHTTYAMIYNRYGWAILSLLCIQLLLGDETTQRRDGALDAAAGGVLLGLLLLCKINFFLVGLGVFVLGLILRPELRRSGLLSIGSLAAIWLVFKGIYGISLVDYLRDVALAAKAQDAGERFGKLRAFARHSLPAMALLAIAWAILVAWPVRKGRMSVMEGVRLSAVAACLVAGMAFLAIGNTGEEGARDLPLLFPVGILLLVQTRASVLSLGHGWWPHVAAATVVVASFLVPLVWRDARSVGEAITWSDYRHSSVPQTQRFDAKPVGDFVVPHTADWKTIYWLSKDVPEHINDGLGLLRRHKRARERILVLAHTDPFSFALGARSPRGPALWWYPNISFSKAYHPAPDTVFGEAELVMVPLLKDSDPGCCKEVVAQLLDLYGGYLHDKYVEIGRSRTWVLYRKRAAG
jgi:hypothetical protein